MKEKKKKKKKKFTFLMSSVYTVSRETFLLLLFHVKHQIKQRRKRKMKQDTIIDSHDNGKLDFYKFIWKYFGVSPREYKHTKDKFKRTLMSEYEEYLEEGEY